MRSILFVARVSRQTAIHFCLKLVLEDDGRRQLQPTVFTMGSPSDGASRKHRLPQRHMQSAHRSETPQKSDDSSEQYTCPPHHNDGQSVPAWTPLSVMTFAAAADQSAYTMI